MKRACMSFLQDWLKSDDRKPLVIRGARQVGKTWIVKELAKSNKKKLLELNFERKPELTSLFESNDPQKIILNISSIFGDVDPQESILFLDEIQVAPELLAKLRWFAEEIPELPVVAAGSLLDLVLGELKFSMPVGRINYMYLEPLSFEEFLLAKKPALLNYIEQYNLDLQIPIAIHNELIEIFKEYIIIGGMPQAVSSWMSKNSLMAVNQIYNDLITTYRDDFNKYTGRLSIERLNEVLTAVPFFLGQKFMYSKVNSDVQAGSIKQALNLICSARICHKINASAGNGVPLGAEIQEKNLKVMLLDVGLCSAMLDLAFNQLTTIKDISLINRGGISEQVTGQILRTIVPCYVDPTLYYWQRAAKGSNAEVDYLIQHQNKVIPLEVKAGSTGSLKSLHLFMSLKKLDVAARVNSDLPSTVVVDIKDYEGKPIKYNLLSVPYYLLGQLPRLLKN